MANKKILHLITGLEVGGAEMSLTRTLSRLNSFDHIVVAIKGHGEAGRLLETAGFRVHYLNPNGAFRLIRSIVAFQRLITEERPDLIITYLPLADILGRIFGRLFGVKKIVTYLRSRGRERKYFWAFLADWSTTFLVDHYFAVSETIRQFYIQRLLINPARITTVPNGVATDVFKPAGPKTAKKSKIIIGTVAQLRKEKGIDVLLRAFAEALKSGAPLHLVIVGTGPEETPLKTLAEQLGIAEKTEFLGQRKDVPQLLQKFDIFVMPSAYEGMSNAILEAMATRLAVMASNTPENKELITNGINGMLFRPSDTKGLAATLHSLIKDSTTRRRLGEQALASAEKNFSLSATARKLEETLTVIFKN